MKVESALVRKFKRSLMVNIPKYRVGEAVLGLLGFIILIFVVFERNTYQWLIRDWFDAPVEILTSPISTNKYTIICHGYGGSIEMMRQLAFDIASAGSNVILFDFIGHGKNQNLLLNQPERIEGTTKQLVDQLISIIDKARFEFGDDADISLIGHSMASDIAIRAAKYSDITSVVAISPYSTAITDNFPRDLLLISGQLERHLRDAALVQVKKVKKNALENSIVLSESLRRKASYITNTGHVSIVYAPQTSKEIIEWLGLKQTGRTLITTQISWIALAAVLLLRLSTKLFSFERSPGHVPNLSFFKASLMMLVSSLLAVPSAAIGYSLIPVFGFSNLAYFFGFYALSLGIFCKLARLDWKWVFDIRLFILVFAIFLAISVFVNNFFGSFVLNGNRFLAFVTLLFPMTLFCIFSEHIINATRQHFAFVLRMIPIVGLVLFIAIYPQKLGLMFTTIPIYVFYFIVFGYVGKFYRKHAGPFVVSICNGIFLSYAFAATNPLFGLA